MDIDINNQDSIANDQPSYNLIDRFPDIYENIFSYLDFKSLIDSCLVCKSWNEHIGQSLELMQKIQVNLKVVSETENKKALEAIKGWKRKICHINVIALGYEKNESVISYLNKNPSILKHLVTIEIGIFNSMTMQYLNHIKNILNASNLLKNLSLILLGWIRITIADWNEFVAAFKTFQLEQLSMTLSAKVIDVAQILDTQMKLKELEIRFFSLSAKMVEAISKMKHLKVLTLQNEFFDDLQLYDDIFMCNMPSLESFNIKNTSRTFYRPIINAANNLIRLSMDALDQEFIDFAGLKLNKLKELHVLSLESIGDIANPDLFPALEELQIDDPAVDVLHEFILQEIDNEPMTNFLRCLYEEIIKPKHNESRNFGNW